MAGKNANITGWFGYKKSGGNTTITITGSGFGEVSGSVKIIGQGVGAVRAQITSWSDTSIVVLAPEDTTIMRVMVYALNDRGREKTAVITPAGETRGTNDPVPTWTVSTIDDTEDAILIDGSDLADVVDVFTYDSSAPQEITHVPSAMDGDTLVVDWPAAFVAPLTNIILSDGNAGNVSEHVQSPGLEPAPNGIITDVTTNAAGTSSVVNLLGSGFGASEGSVTLIRDGGAPEPTPVITNGWTQTVVQVSATPATTYESVMLERADGEVATIAASFPASFMSAVVATGPTVAYDADADILTFSSAAPIFGNGDAIAYSTVEAGAGYGLSAPGNMTVVDANTIVVTGADAKIVGETLNHIDFYNNAGPTGSWDGSVVVTAA